jgi:SEC-C motif domain protein
VTGPDGGMSSNDCPCHSRRRYPACCAPFHRGEVEAPTPGELMRSRYAAFALNLGPYLYRTLASSHPERARGEADFLRELARGRRPLRYVGLLLLHEAAVGDAGEVLFFARLFEKGQSRSFAELSSFVREGGGWRYADGVLLPDGALPREVGAMTRESFLALVAAAGVSA